MAWYDLFARVYDGSLEAHYREQRARAVEALELEPDSVVLDLPCGTGQSFAGLAAQMGPQGMVLGVDLSSGMLRSAQRRITATGWRNVRALQRDVTALELEDIERVTARGVRPNRLHVFLGMSVFPDPLRAFERLWSLLAPGGVCVLVDVYTPQLGLQGRVVNWIARADITRRFWEPLEAMGTEFSRVELPSKPLHGGQIYLAKARKPLSQMFA